MFATHMDFAGQALAERLYQAIIITATVVGFCVGYAQQDFKLTFQIWAGGFVLASLASVVPWPWYRRAPIKWLDKAERFDDAAASSSSGSSGAAKDDGKKRR